MWTRWGPRSLTPEGVVLGGTLNRGLPHENKTKGNHLDLLRLVLVPPTSPTTTTTSSSTSSSILRLSSYAHQIARQISRRGRRCLQVGISLDPRWRWTSARHRSIDLRHAVQNRPQRVMSLSWIVRIVLSGVVPRAQVMLSARLSYLSRIRGHGHVSLDPRRRQAQIKRRSKALRHAVQNRPQRVMSLSYILRDVRFSVVRRAQLTNARQSQMARSGNDG